MLFTVLNVFINVPSDYFNKNEISNFKVNFHDVSNNFENKSFKNAKKTTTFIC